MAKTLLVPSWVLPMGYGLTIYKLVIVDKTSEDLAYVIAHEMCHVKQWTEIGFFKFPYLYIKELIKNGYMDNIYEVEARAYGIAHRSLYKDF